MTDDLPPLFSEEMKIQIYKDIKTTVETLKDELELIHETIELLELIQTIGNINLLDLGDWL